MYGNETTALEHMTLMQLYAIYVTHNTMKSVKSHKTKTTVATLAVYQLFCGAQVIRNRCSEGST